MVPKRLILWLTALIVGASISVVATTSAANAALPADGDRPDSVSVSANSWGATYPAAAIGFNLRSCPDLSCSWSGGLTQGAPLLDTCFEGGWDLVMSRDSRHVAGFAPTGNISGEKTSNWCSVPGFWGGTNTTFNTNFNLRACPQLSCAWAGGVTNLQGLVDICYLPSAGWDLVYVPSTNHAGWAPSGHLNSPLTPNQCA